MTLPANPPTPDLVFYVYDLPIAIGMGNTRVTYSTSVVCGGSIDYTLEAVVDYFLYGKILRQYTNSEQEKYLSTQHERDLETGLDHRGARFYDADLGRFLSLDPLAADFPDWSDYNYVLGNPLMFIDPDGKAPIVAIPAIPALTLRGIIGLGRVTVRAIRYRHVAGAGRLALQAEARAIAADAATLTGKGIKFGTRLKALVDLVIGTNWAPTIPTDGGAITEPDTTIFPDGSTINPDGTTTPGSSTDALPPVTGTPSQTITPPGAEGLTGTSSQTIPETGVKEESIYQARRRDSSANERHGDNGRAMTKAERQTQQLEKDLKKAKSKKEKYKIKQKIKNIKNAAQRKRKGEEHSKGNKH